MSEDLSKLIKQYAQWAEEWGLAAQRKREADLKQQAEIEEALQEAEQEMQMIKRIEQRYDLPPASSEEGSLVEEFHTELEDIVREASADLEPNEHLIVYTYDGPEMLLVESFGFSVGEMLIVYGRDLAGNNTTLVAHFQNIRVGMRRVKLEPTVPRRTIGFQQID